MIRVTAFLSLAFAGLALAGEVATAAAPTPLASPQKRYIVVFNRGASVDDDEVKRGGGTVHMHFTRYMVVSLPEPAVAAFKKNKSVKYVQLSDVADGNGSGASFARAATIDAAVPLTTPVSWTSGDYDYDGAGNIAAIGSSSTTTGTNGRTTELWYDSVSRLKRMDVHETNVPARSEVYAYDAYGNLTSGPYSAIPIDPATNRFQGWTAIRGTGPGSYDPGGSVTAIGSEKRYYYDAYGLLNVSVESNRMTHYLYGPTDERIGLGEETLGVTPAEPAVWWTWSLRDGDGKVVRQYMSADPSSIMGTVQAGQLPDWIWLEDYAYRNGQLLGAERVPEEGGRRHFHIDHLGTPRVITGPNGVVRVTHDYSAFGVEVTSMRSDIIAGADRIEPMQYTGHERDNKGDIYADNTNYIDYMHARNYMPIMGRFLSVDPLGGNPYRPQTWNRYTYTLDNPLGFTDPAGLSPCSVVGSDGKEHPGECIDVNARYDRDVEEWSSINRRLDREAIEKRARAGDEFAALQLNFSREIHNPLYARGIEPTNDDFLVIAPLTGLLRNIGLAGGEIGLKAAADGGASFFDGATFRLGGKLDVFHNFPESVMAFEDAGTVTTIPSAGGTTSQMLQIPGGYMGREGVFEFIKNNMNEITHYFFHPTP